ncbi:hypothetical protein BDR05DRAFT_1007064 [Suillus weaverae]|nr:hypothetical protein BDR05DRAFT_1007064 [Suillus weaverae]
MSCRVLVVLDPRFSRASVQDSYGCIDWVTHDYPALLAANLLCSPTLCFVSLRLHEKVRVFDTFDVPD